MSNIGEFSVELINNMIQMLDRAKPPQPLTFYASSEKQAEDWRKYGIPNIPAVVVTPIQKVGKQ